MTIQEEIIEATYRYLEVANALLSLKGRRPIPKPTFVFSNRTSRVSGQATTYRYPWGEIKNCELKFNTKTASSFHDEFLKQTVGHEVAHLMANALGANGHDHIWSSCCVQLGVIPKRFSTYQIPGYHAYTCPKCGQIFQFSTRVHNKIMAKETSFRCNTCLTEIVKA